MSPEQLSGDKVDGRSDLYSLALVFFRMLTGKLPFEATTVQETMIKRLTDEPIKLAVARPDLAFPTGLQEVLDAALTRAPADRYQSVAKFAADVTAVVGTTLEGAALPATRADVESKTQLLEPPRAPARGGGGGGGGRGAAGRGGGGGGGGGERLGDQGNGAREETPPRPDPLGGDRGAGRWSGSGKNADVRAQGRRQRGAAGHGTTSGGERHYTLTDPGQH